MNLFKLSEFVIVTVKGCLGAKAPYGALAKSKS